MNANETKRDDVDETGARLRQTLADTFGFRSFRPYQEEIVRAILRGEDVFAVMPTGGGKSLCYQLPAVCAEGMCVVVSPLISLMKDQVDAAITNGINAATINSTTTGSEFREIAEHIDHGRLELLYVSPERFNNARFKETLQNANVSFFAIDEAHCISQWGHNFRSDYLELGQIVDEFPNCPVAAFTATATEQVGEDIVSSLKLRNPFRVKASFDRPNLFYQIEYKDDFERQLLDFLKECPGESGIVYRSTRKSVEQTAETLVKHGYKAEAYHAGMSDADRIAVQDRFARDETPIIVATIAFGMGIDKSNVRFVVHGDLPKDVESYYQETGRAGRDGAPSRCLLLFGYQDVAIHRSFLKDYEDETARAAAEQRLNEMVRFVETDGCRRVNLLRYFGETYKPRSLGGSVDEENADGCGSCDYCVGACKRVDATIDAQKALSAMARTGNRVGATHLTDVLVGALTEKVERFGHNELPTFGVGKDKSKRYWRYLIQALLTQGIAELDPNSEFPVPKVTSLGWEVMRGRRTVEIVERPDRATKKARAKAVRNASNLKDSLNLKDRKLFETLRTLRAQIAKAENVPPYVVFNDKSLVEMAILKPRTDKELLDCSGVGVRKLQNYGEDFIDAIERFLEEN